MKHESEKGAEWQCLETKTGVPNIDVEGVENKSEEGDDVIKALEDCHDVANAKDDLQLQLLPMVYNYNTGWCDMEQMCGSRMELIVFVMIL